MALALVGCGGSNSLVAAPGFSRATIDVAGSSGKVELDVEVAANSKARQHGLMFRQELPDSHGMLFVYPSSTGGGHWMKNTYIPLDIAYIDDTGLVMEVVQGRPLDTTVLAATAPYRYVLEVRAGWFDDFGFGPGSQLLLPEDLPLGE